MKEDLLNPLLITRSSFFLSVALQSCVIRAVFCDWNLAYEDLLQRANLFSPYNTRLQDIAIFMYKAKHRLLPSNIFDLFSGTPPGHSLSNSDFHISRFYSVHYA